MKRPLTLLFASLTFSLVAQADPISAEVGPLSKDGRKVLIKSTQLQTVKPGDMLSLPTCTLEVMKLGQSRAVLSTELCEDKSLLRKGQVLNLESERRAEPPLTRPSRNHAANGFRFGLVKSFLDGKVTVSGKGLALSVSDKVEHDFGAALGYSYIPVHQVGVSPRLLFTQYTKSSNSLRLDANLTYGVNEYVYFFGGLNVHKLLKDDIGLEPGIGYQAGAGFQLSRNFGLDLNYVYIHNRGHDRIFDYDFQASGIELTLHATF